MMKLDIAKPGLHALLRPYICALLQRLYEVTNSFNHTNAQGSGKLWTWLNENAERLGFKKMSRASVIFALNDMVDMGILKWADRTGKGGHHRIYSVAMTPAEFEVHVTNMVVGKVAAIFEPDWWRLGK